MGRRAAQDVSLPAVRGHVCDGRGEKDEQGAGIPFRIAGKSTLLAFFTLCIHIHAYIHIVAINAVYLRTFIYMYCIFSTICNKCMYVCMHA